MESVVKQKKSKLSGFVSLLLVIVLGILASKLMWMVVTPSNPPSYQKQEVSIEPNSQRKMINYGKLIADQHLFGEIENPKIVKVSTLPPKKSKPVVIATKLNLKLHGIVAYKKRAGFALISSGGGVQKVYKEGEPIQKGVTVAKIFSEKVILDNHGQEEVLLLPVKKVAARSTKPTPANKSAGLLDHRSSLLPPVQKSKNSTRVDLGQFREELKSNPAMLMELVRASPAIVNGQFIGYRIYPGRKRKRFKELGFRPNDIITEVNGILLDDKSKSFMVLNELSSASSVSLRVKRGQQIILMEQSF